MEANVQAWSFSGSEHCVVFIWLTCGGSKAVRPTVTRAVMAVSLLPNWLHVTLVFLFLPGEFYSFLLSGSAPLVHFILAVHVKDEDHIFMTLLCRLMVCFSQLLVFRPDALYTMF